MPTNKPRYTVIVDDELFEAIEDYRYVNRIPSRSEASVALIRLGIQALKEISCKVHLAPRRMKTPSESAAFSGRIE